MIADEPIYSITSKITTTTGFLRLPGFGQGVIGRRKLRNDKNPVNPV